MNRERIQFRLNIWVRMTMRFRVTAHHDHWRNGSMTARQVSDLIEQGSRTTWLEQPITRSMVRNLYHFQVFGRQLNRPGSGRVWLGPILCLAITRKHDLHVVELER